MVCLPNLKLDQTIVRIGITRGIGEEVDGQRVRVAKVSITGVQVATGEDVTCLVGALGPVGVGAGVIAGVDLEVGAGVMIVGDHAAAQGAGAGATRARGVDLVQEHPHALGRDTDIDGTRQEHGGTLGLDLAREIGLVVLELLLSSASHPLDVVMHRLIRKTVITTGSVGGIKTEIARGGTRMSWSKKRWPRMGTIMSSLIQDSSLWRESSQRMCTRSSRASALTK